MNPIRICRAALVTAAGFVLSSVAARAGTWHGVGPYGADIQEFEHCAGKPSIVYALTHKGGIFRSADRGLTWTSASGGLPAQGFGALAVDPSNGDSVWLAAGNDPVLFHTADGGKHWNKVQVAGSTQGTLALAVSPGDGSVVFAGTFNGLFRSLDGGQSWQHITQGLSGDSPVISIAADIGNPQLVFAAAAGTGLVISKDRGASWQLTAGQAGVYDLKADPHRSGVVVGKTFSDLYRTSDAGQHWRKIDPISQPGSPVSFSFGAGTPSDVLVTFPAQRPVVFKVKGATGRVVPYAPDTASPSPTAIDADPDHDGAVLVGSSTGVRRTTNNGRAWTTTVDGLLGVPTQQITVLGRASFVSGNLRTVDGGAHWQSLLPGLWTGATAFDATNKSLYAATSPPAAGGSVALWRSKDGGATWQAVAENIAFGSPTALAIDRLRPETLYLGVETYDGALLLRTTDAGATWARLLYTSAVTDIDTTTGHPQCIFIALGGAIERSCDAGKSWIDVLQADFNTLNEVAVAPSDTRRVYAVEGSYDDEVGPRVWRSSDAGITFEPLDVPAEGFGSASIAVDPLASDVIYVGMSKFNSGVEGSVWRKRGDGPWEDLTSGLFNRSVTALHVDGGASHRLFACTGGGIQILALGTRP